MAKNSNILIIEDNETFSLLITHYLKNNLPSSHVFVENSGMKAIETIHRLNPAVVVLDYYLDEQLSAKDVMIAISDMKPIPHVILLSTITDESERLEIMKMGVGEFIPKSNESMYDLAKLIQEHLNGRNENINSNTVSTSPLIKNLAIGGLFVLVLILVFFLLSRMD